MGLAVRTRAIERFSGIITSIDSRDIGAEHAQALSNVEVEDGSIRPRYGFNTLRSPQSGFTAVWGLGYISGFNSARSPVEEYISIEKISGTNRAVSRVASSGAETLITGATGLHESTWTFVTFDTVCYALNPNNTDPIYKHTIGDASSWNALKPAAAPTFTMAITAVMNGSDQQVYDQLSFAGIDPSTEVTYAGAAQSSGSSLGGDNTLSINHAASTGVSSFRIDMNGSSGGKPDWTYNDCFEFTLVGNRSKTQFDVDKGMFKVRLTNNSGTDLYGDVEVIDLGGTTVNLGLRVAFPNKTRASFASVRYIEIEYKVTVSSSTPANRLLTMSKWWVGCIPWDEIDRTPGAHEFCATYYNSSALFESGPGAVATINRAQARGYSPIPGMSELGSWLKFSGLSASSDSSVDKTRIYFSNPVDGKKYQVAEENDTTSTTTVKKAVSEIVASTAYTLAPFTYANAAYAFQGLGTICWLYKGNSENVRWGRIGEPEKQSSLLDEPDDDNQGQTFSLAAGFADEPVGGVSLGRVQVILGKKGVYAQQGVRARDLTPPFRLPNSQGCAGPLAFTAWRDDAGNHSVVYVTTLGEVAAAVITDGYDRDSGYKTFELSDPIRGEIRNWLITQQAALGYTDFSAVRVWTDASRDALWIVMGQRAMVLRRKSMSDGARYWEPYYYNFGGSVTCAYGAASEARRMRAMLSDGRFVEFEWNSTTGSYITGATRDGGSARPANSTWWRSKKFVGANRRVDQIFVERDTMGDTVTIEITSTRQTASVTIAANKRFARTGPKQQGFEHDFKLILSESASAVRRITWNESEAGRAYNR